MCEVWVQMNRVFGEKEVVLMEEEDILEGEKDALYGVSFLKRDIFGDFSGDRKFLGVSPIYKMKERAKGEVIGRVVKVQQKVSKAGKGFAFAFGG